MLRCLVSDLSRAGHRTVTLIDSRLRNSSSLIRAAQIISVYSKAQLAKIFWRTLESVDAAYVIAPEGDGTLEAFVRKLGESGVLSLNCSADSIHRSSDKALSFEVLRNAGLRVPETRIIDLREGSETAAKEAMGIGTSFILKPLSGGGCLGLSLVSTQDEVKVALAKIKRVSKENFVIAQEAIQGIAASVNILCTSEGASWLTLNQQFVRLSSPRFESSYLGGLVPLEHDLEDQALEAAIRAVESIPGLTGYVGVDMVLAEDGVHILEVNPRLTTSYIGARRVLEVNLAQAIVQAAFKRESPPNIRTAGCAVFYKVQNARVPAGEFSKERLQLDVISPSLYKECAGLSLVLVYTPAFAAAKKVQSVLAEAESD